jgi:putative AlgH/UPF0301 family transcriptional regulator
MVVHTSEEMSDLEIVPRLYFTTERPKIEWLLQHHPDESKYFVGYSGRAAGQLEAEIKTGSWLSCEANISEVFSDKPDQWAELLKLATVGKWVDPQRIPKDPSLN